MEEILNKTILLVLFFSSILERRVFFLPFSAVKNTFAPISFLAELLHVPC